jgi:quercetin dioxygenase-like cupin family protein
MKAIRTVLVIPMFALAWLHAPTAGAQGHADHIMVTPGKLKWADVPSLPPGAKIAVIEGPLSEAKPFTIRLKLPADYRIPPHWHPAIEHVTVISGTFNMGTGDKLDRKKTTALSAGSVAIMQPKTNHFAWTKGATIVQVHGVGPWAVNYVNPADDPRKK